MQKCNECGLNKETLEFYPYNKRCKKCISVYSKTYNTNIGSASKRAKNKLKEGQSCEICGREDFLEFDHVDIKNKKINLGGGSPSVDNIMAEAVKCRFLCTWCHRLHTRQQQQLVTNNRLVELNKLIDSIEDKIGRACPGTLCKGKILPYSFFRIRNGKPEGLCIRCVDLYRLERKDNSRKYINKMKRALGFCDICNMEVIKGFEVCFDWDHVDPSTKKCNISEFVSKSIQNTDIIDDELRKCRLLCCFCHLTHTNSLSTVDDMEKIN